MRQFALVGLVASLLLGAAGIFQAGETVQLRRGYQERVLQSSVGNEMSLIADYRRQDEATLAVMLANPAVRSLVEARTDAGALTGTRRSSDVRTVAASLAAIQRTSPVPMTAACLDGASAEQLVCAPSARAPDFPTALDRQLLALARHGVSNSATFLSPVSLEPTIALVVPVRVGGRLRGLVHLDVGLLSAAGSDVLVRTGAIDTIELGSYGDGRVELFGQVRSARTSLSSAPSAPLAIGRGLSARPRQTIFQGHRVVIAALPLALGSQRRHVVVAAIAVKPNPDLLNVWSPGLVAMMAIAALLLLGSLGALLVSNRRISRELLTDPLTGLRNRRALMEELPRACQRASVEQPAFLWFFDLNGFKSYNDSFGHVAGDALLARLSERLQLALHGRGSVYRLGGDEFCALLADGAEDAPALLEAATEALCERGAAFAVTCAAGEVQIPRDARDPMHALRLADQHMYAQKAASRGGAAELITSVLHAALAQRHPDLGEHSEDVAGDVELLARTIGLDEQSIEEVIKAGDLHDVGKLGIPDEIITKPGALSEEEWEFMRQHTVMGEQILAAAGPSLERIGPLVRASHERWDGKGYPDGLAGEEIPLGARIITICDSFRAMLDERSYKRSMSLEQALAELRRCAGTQFDPSLVEVFCRLVSERTALAPGQPPSVGPGDRRRERAREGMRSHGSAQRTGARERVLNSGS